MFDDFDHDDDELLDETERENHQRESSLKLPRQMSEWHGDPDIENQLLQLAQSSRMPHSLIFAGPAGIGKSTMAFRLARYLFKHGDGQGDAAAESGGGLFGEEELPQILPENFDLDVNDQVFKLIASGGHPDMLYIEREYNEKSGKMREEITAEQARRIGPFLRMKPSMGGWRVVVIDDADTMNRTAQNAILKILEEPPKKTLLVLIAHRPGSMIATIRSRCRVIPFPVLTHDQFASMMRTEDASIGQSDLDILYSLSGGSIGKGLMVHEEGGLEAVGKVIGLFSGWPQWNWLQIHELADNLGRKGNEEALHSFENVMLWLGESLTKAKARGEPHITGLNNEILNRMLSYYSLEDWIDICEKLRTHYDTVQQRNLDNTFAVLGTFSIFDDKKAA